MRVEEKQQPEVRDTDEACLTRAKVEREAFGELVRRYADRIFNLAYRMTGDRSAAQDLTQETFLRAYQGLAGFKEGSAVAPWLYRIAVNACLSYRQRQETTAAEPLDETVAVRLFDSGVPPDELAEQREVQATVQRAILALPPRYRAVVILYHLEDRPYSEIADILGLPVNTVRTHLHRGREMLREILARDNSLR